MSHYDIVKLEIKYSAVRKEKFIVYYYTIYLLQYHSLKPSFIAHRLKIDFLISEYDLFVFLILKNGFSVNFFDIKNYIFIAFDINNLSISNIYFLTPENTLKMLKQRLIDYIR